MKQCWLPRAMRRKGLGSRASQTPGSAKNWNCQLDPNSTGMARHNRSHKNSDYANWSARHRGGKTPYFDARSREWEVQKGRSD